ncbi:DNA-3-methyladenine glycosylase [soil metagenome]
MASEQSFVECGHFAGAVEEVALDLVGRTLRVVGDEGPLDALIVETEAYGGFTDPASHAAFKPRGGARLMWERPGTIYVYAAYGMYPCLNIVSEQTGEPGAVLVRGVWLHAAEKPTLGPGRVGRLLNVTLADNGQLCCGPRFYVSDDRKTMTVDATPRIGITRSVDTPWRFIAQLD